MIMGTQMVFIWLFEVSKARQWIVWLGWLRKFLLLSCHRMHSRELLSLMRYEGEHGLLLLSYHCMCGQVPIQVSMVSSSLMSLHEWQSIVSHRSEQGDFFISGSAHHFLAITLIPHVKSLWARQWWIRSAPQWAFLDCYLLTFGLSILALCKQA
jgi:hypothetical protein